MVTLKAGRAACGLVAPIDDDGDDQVSWKSQAIVTVLSRGLFGFFATGDDGDDHDTYIWSNTIARFPR